MKYLGIDIGGSGIKGAVVDISSGELTTERVRIETPRPALPMSIGKTVDKIIRQLGWRGNVGIGFPAAIVGGVVKTASNIDESWIGVDADTMFGEITGKPCIAINDADAAGLAEMSYGAGKNKKGIVMLITVGTGIGTVIFNDGMLLPNSELGHIYLGNGLKAEHFASDAVRKRESLKWKKWGKRFNEYLRTLEDLFWPELIIIGGGASKKFDKFAEVLDTRTEVIPAALRNEAGIIGAAVAAKNAKR